MRLPEAVRWWSFNALSRLAASLQGQRQCSVVPTPVATESAAREEYLWVFCSTIGEFNACRPLIEALYQRYNLLLMTDRSCYEQAYKVRCPKAAVVELDGSAKQYHDLIRGYPPTALVVCEIPCAPNDAPCRLAYGLLRTVKQTQARIYLVNGWLYGYPPSCREDALERAWFTQDFYQLFDVLTVQTEQVKASLVSRGCDGDKIHVTGNMKFDAIDVSPPLVKDLCSGAILAHLDGSTSTVFVAGCLSEFWEYQLVIESFVLAKQDAPDMVLVFVPRHPENTEHMKYISDLLQRYTFNIDYKTKLAVESEYDFDILVLDTVGELQAYYAHADITYVGRNHNVLEPLVFEKPVIVHEGWEESYPSYPVYQIVNDKNIIIEVSSAQMLCEELTKLASDGSRVVAGDIKTSLRDLSGVYEKNHAILGL